MKIHGIQKLTLLDYPGQVACTVFLGGCDFRCPFCHNYQLVAGDAGNDDGELFDYLRRRRGMLDGVAVTGGEPCLRPDLPEFLRQIKHMGYRVKLDTNGSHPDMLRALRDGGLIDYVAMDIKNSPDKYAMTIGLDAVDLSKIRESIQLLIHGNVDYEFRTTVVDELHEPQDFHGIGGMVAGGKAHYLQVFTDRDTVPYGNLHAPDMNKLNACADVLRKYVARVEIRGA